MNDIEMLENMRDNIYGAMQFEDDYQVSELEKKEFHALNSAITALKERQADKDRIKELEDRNEKLYEDNLTLAQELKDTKGYTAAEIKLLEEEAYCKGRNDENIYYSNYVDNNYIPKSLVKEKIQELNKQEKAELKGMKGQDRYVVKLEYQHKRSVLQELLGEKQ